jgi:peptidoglycan/xylan/chitin deacetylase (PgdA/CDA1 family)
VSAVNSFVLFSAIVAAVTLAGAGIGESRAGSSSPSPRPVEVARATSTPTAAPLVTPPTAPPAPTATEPPVEPAARPSCGPGSPPSCAAGSEPTPLPSLPAASPVTAARVPIFEYHRVKPLERETGLARDLIVTPDLFESQMAAMDKAGWRTMTMAELGDDLRLGIQPRPKSFVVTLDDGYDDGYTYAFPILSDHGFVATYFVVGGRIGSPEHLTVAELQALLAAGSEIGNHTQDHVDLRPLTPERMRSEIYDASAAIAQAIGVWPQSFCYPFGKTNAAASAAVGAVPGIETAAIETGSQQETWANRLTLPRIRIGPGSSPQYLLYKAAWYLQ